MFREDYEAAANASASKYNMLKKNPVGYFLLSMLAGVFVGFGMLLCFTVGGVLQGAAATKILMGLSFGVGLSLVMMAGSELFTGNNFVMASGIAKKKVTIGNAIVLWIVCYIGNLAGSILVGALYHMTGLGNSIIGEFMASGALAKMSVPAMQLIGRGILCNILVCLAVWCGFRCKSESGKLIMIAWCLFAFVTCGFEHSIANMTLFTAALLNPFDQALTVGGAAYNLLFVTLGNMIGGILFMAVPYYLASKEK